MHENILYTPIDLITPKINLNNLLKLFFLKCSIHYTKLWKYYTIISRGYQNYEENWNSRYDSTNFSIKYDKDIFTDFPEIFITLKKLPFLQLTHVNILYQIDDIPPHIDYHKDEKIHKKNLCYKWLIYPGISNSFYVLKDEKKYFINPPKNNLIFAIQESEYKHGAIKKDDHKLIISIFGILDEKNHRGLISQSTKKFKNEIINV